MNILFIYNEISDINNIEQHLNNAGHKIFVAKNQPEALEILSRIKIDLIICEMISDKIDGVQILRKLKTSESYSHIPFALASSSLKDEEDISFFRRLGAITVIDKPITYKSIQNIIDKNITSQKLGFETRHKILSDEDFLEEYSNLLTKRIQKRVKELESDQLFIHNIINSIPSAIFLINQDFRIIDINETGMKYIGISNREDIIGKLCYNLIYKTNKICNFEGHRCPIIGVIKEKNTTQHYLIIGNNDNKRHLNIHFAPVLHPKDNTMLMLENIVDNTGIVEIINKSKENELKFETILSESRYGIILIEDNRIVNINNSAKRLIGMEDEEIESFIKIIDSQIFTDMIDTINQNVIYRKELSIFHNNEERVIILEAQKVSSIDKNLILVIMYDFTENHRLIQSLKDSELLKSTILDNIQDIFILIKGHTIIETSKKIENIIKKKREAILRQDIFSAIPFIKESHIIDTTPKEILYTDEAGREKTFNIKPIPLILKGEKFTLLQITDITEQKEREIIEERHKEKIKYIDRLDIAAKIHKGLTHNINNFLGGINILAEYLTKPNIKQDKIAITASIIKKLTKNAANALSKISNFLNVEIKSFKPIDLQKILDELIDIFKYCMPKNIQLKYERFSKNNFILGDYNTLLQAFINMVLNAIEAMPNGGTITINTTNTTESDKDLKPIEILQIRISDTGLGIPNEIKNNIFSPYFSSKNIPGTGLGLSVVYNAILNHNGSITFDSQPQKGTTFIISLPVVKDIPETKEEEEKGSKEKILIISENSIEREIIKRILIKYNYDAYTAIDSYDAVESLKITKPSIIIMESNLTRVSAEDTFDKIIEVFPEANILLYTGLILDEKTTNLILKGVKSVLYKPLDIKELLATIKSTLGESEIKSLPNNESEPIRKILIIDDEEYILSALKMNLSDKYEISIETSTTKSLDRILSGESFDKYIIDINMPDINGIEFYKMIKEVDQNINKKVIFITGGITDEKIINELNNLKDEVLLIEKPFDIEELIKLLS